MGCKNEQTYLLERYRKKRAGYGSSRRTFPSSFSEPGTNHFDHLVTGNEETIYHLAVRYNVPVDEIKFANSLSFVGRESLHPGMHVKIPKVGNHLVHNIDLKQQLAAEQHRYPDRMLTRDSSSTESISKPSAESSSSSAAVLQSSVSKLSPSSTASSVVESYSGSSSTLSDEGSASTNFWREFEAEIQRSTREARLMLRGQQATKVAEKSSSQMMGNPRQIHGLMDWESGNGYHQLNSFAADVIANFTL